MLYFLELGCILIIAAIIVASRGHHDFSVLRHEELHRHADLIGKEILKRSFYGIQRTRPK